MTPNCTSGDTYATMAGMPTPVISMLVVMSHPVMMDPTSATDLLAKAAWRAASSAAVRSPLALAGRGIPAAGRRKAMAAMLGWGGVGWGELRCPCSSGLRCRRRCPARTRKEKLATEPSSEPLTFSAIISGNCIDSSIFSLSKE